MNLLNDSSSPPVRIGIIGAGAIARIVAKYLPDQPSIQVVAVADVVFEAAAKLAKLIPGARVAESPEALLADDSVELVYLATPPFHHRAGVESCLLANKSVICEKPLAATVEEAAKIATLAARSDLMVACCASRYIGTEAARITQEVVRSRRLGTLETVYFRSIVDPPKKSREGPAWRVDRQLSGGGVVADWGIYDLNWLCHALGGAFRPRSVFATLRASRPVVPTRTSIINGLDGQFSACFQCPEGLTVHLERRAEEHGPSQHQIAIRGSAGGIDTTMVPSPEGVRFFEYTSEDLISASLGGGAEPSSAEVIFPLIDAARALRTDHTPACDAATGAFLQRLVEGIYASAESGQVIKFP